MCLHLIGEVSSVTSKGLLEGRIFVHGMVERVWLTVFVRDGLIIIAMLEVHGNGLKISCVSSHKKGGYGQNAKVSVGAISSQTMAS